MNPERRQRAPSLPSAAEVIRLLMPLVSCSSERSGWNHAAQILNDVFDAEIAAALEFVDADRATVRSWLGVASLPVGSVVPVAPDAQAAFAREDGGVVVSDDLCAEHRFVPGRMLVEHGIRSSMSMSIDIAGLGRTVLGVHSSVPGRFTQTDADVFESIAGLIGSAMTRLRERDGLELDARIDPLTGLMNRGCILETLGSVFDGAGPTSALLIDIDGFKTVNDVHGHRSGDTVLQTIAARIERSIGSGDRLGRLGGDEFLLLTDQEEPDEFAHRIIGHVEEVVLIESGVVQLSASVGIARRRSGDTAPDLLERADRLMFTAKAAGRGQVRSDIRTCHTPTDVARPRVDTGGAATSTQVDEALAGLRVVVQPIIDATSGRLHGVEALARGPHGHVLEFPERLFPSATTFGRLGELELEAKRLAFDLPLAPDSMLYVNCEPVLLASRPWISDLAAAWHASARRPSVTVEVTERAVLATPGRLLRAVEMCRELGWMIALDDVGSRSESLAALRWIDPDIVKLDMSLISGRNSAHTAHVNSAVASHRNLRELGTVRVIAEGVESTADVRSADVLGADLLQGYLLGRPIDIADLSASHSEHLERIVSDPPRPGADRIATKRQLIAMTRDVEASVLSADAILIASFQRRNTLSARTCRQYEGLARRCAFVGMIGPGLSSVDEARLHGVRLADHDADDPLSACWHVITLSPTSSLALLATEVTVEREPDDLDRLFSYRFVTDPAEVEDAARRLLRYF